MKILIDTEINATQVKGMIQDAEAKLIELGKENCEPTSRLMPDNDDRAEWSASVTVIDNEGTERTLTAYYYTTPEDSQLVEDNGGDWGAVCWEIGYYKLG